MTTSQGKKKGKGQLSTKSIQEKIRPYTEEAIQELVKLMQLPVGTNDNVKLGAIKTLLAKVVPDLKAIEYKDQKGNPIMPTYIKIETLNNDNTPDPVAEPSSNG